MSESLQMTEKF